MARIRTIKPELFKHEDLFDAEMQTGLPLRVAFPGLFTQCDREGRFAWRPRQLKADVLPYDDLEFSRVLHALSTREFIIKYEVDGKAYGFIPSWHKHQAINPRESASVLPPPTPEAIEKAKETDALVTRDGRDHDACSTRDDASHKERKGKEGNHYLASESVHSAAREAEKVPPFLPAEDASPQCTNETAKSAEPSQAGSLRNEIVKAFQSVGCEPVPDTGRAETWIAQGYDPKICAAVVVECLGKNSKIRNLSYCDQRIREAHEKRASNGQTSPSNGEVKPQFTDEEKRQIDERRWRRSLEFSEQYDFRIWDTRDGKRPPDLTDDFVEGWKAERKATQQ